MVQLGVPSSGKLSGHDGIEEDVRQIKSKQFELGDTSSIDDDLDGSEDEEVDGLEDND
jgi:hypothetical protein